MTSLPAGIDSRLWFTLHGSSDHYYLTGNPDTFPGRMSAFDPRTQRGFCVSKSEIATSSPEAEYWIQGFLCGNLPTRPCSPEGHLLPDHHPQMRQWEQQCAHFLETGAWPPDQGNGTGDNSGDAAP
jgi:hypothetical protein